MWELKPEGCRPASPPTWSTWQPSYAATLVHGNLRKRNLGLPNQCVFGFYWTCAIQLKRTGNDGDTAPNQGSNINLDDQHRATVTECDSTLLTYSICTSCKFMACSTSQMLWTGKRVLQGTKFIPCMWIWGMKKILIPLFRYSFNSSVFAIIYFCFTRVQGVPWMGT